MKRFIAAAFVALLAASPALAGTGYGTLIKESGPGQASGVCQSAVAVPHTGDTAEFTLATCTVPKKALGANGRMVVRATFSHTNSANNKTLKVHYSGVAGTAYLSQVNTTTAAGRYEVLIANRGATNSQVGGLMTSTAAAITSAVDTVASTTIVITGQLANSGETVTLESYSVELFPAP